MRIFKDENKLIRQMLFAGFFHFLHIFLSILLLLLIGQIVTHADSAKSQLFELLTLGFFDKKDLWIWVAFLLLLKFIGTSMRNYHLQTLPFNMQLVLQKYWLNQKNSRNVVVVNKEIKNYSKAFIRIWLIGGGDICLLSIIFVILLFLNIWVSLFWLIFLITSVLFRWWVVRHYLSSKTENKSAKSNLLRKWRHIFFHKRHLKVQQQWDKEIRILKRREDVAKKTFRVFGIQKAWTSGFFPLYFFIFLFVIAAFFQNESSDHAVVLQMILLIVYSQSALMRCFKAPEQWKIMREIENKWNSLSVKKNITQYIPEILFEELENKINSENTSQLSTEQSEQLISVFNSDIESETEASKKFFRHITLLDIGQQLIGETYLSSVLSDREKKQMPILSSFFEYFEEYDWASFPWKQNIEKIQCSEQELNWIQLFRALLHPGYAILCKQDLRKKLSEKDLLILLSLSNKTNKSIFLWNEKTNSFILFK